MNIIKKNTEIIKEESSHHEDDSFDVNFALSPVKNNQKAKFQS